MADFEGAAPIASGALFEKTRWSVIKAAASSGGASEGAEAALSWLCSAYWMPLYSFLRRSGRSREDAEDVVQEFFARLKTGRILASALPERGRFRTFMLAALKNLDRDIHRADVARKRGGDREHVPLDLAMAEERWQADSDNASSPEVAFDQAWATALMERASARLRSQFESENRSAVFAEFFPRISGGMPSDEIKSSASRLGMSVDAARMAMSRLRRRYAEMIRAEIAETVGSRDDEADELRYLLSSFS